MNRNLLHWVINSLDFVGPTRFFIRNRFIWNWYYKCQNFKKLPVLSQTTPIKIRNRIDIFPRKIFTFLFFMAEVLGGILCVLVFVRLRLIRHLLPMSNPILDLRTWYFTFSLLDEVLWKFNLRNCSEISGTRNGVKIKKLLALQAVLSFLVEKKACI